MTRICWLLLIVIAAQIAGLVVFRDRLRRPPNSFYPRPDISVLDSMSAGEILSRQKKLEKDGKPESWTDLASIYVMYGFFREADYCCQRSDKLTPNSMSNNFWWGATLFRLGQLRESSEKFRAMIASTDPSQVGICHYCIGVNFLREECVDEAERAFRKGIGHPPAEYELAKILVRSGRADQAVPILEKLTKDDPKSARYWLLRANAMLALGDAENADSFFDRAEVASIPQPADELTAFLQGQIGRFGLDLQIKKGEEFLKLRKWSEAADILRNALQREWRPTTADLLADALLELGQTNETVSVVNGAIDRYGATPARLTNLGDALAAKGTSDEAVNQWEHAIRVGLAGRAHSRLADYHAKMEDQKKSDYHRAIATRIEGLYYLRQDRVEDAMKRFESAVKFDAENADAWFYLGECQRILNEAAAADSAYRKCLAVNPFHGRAKRSLKRLPATENTGLSP